MITWWNFYSIFNEFINKTITVFQKKLIFSTRLFGRGIKIEGKFFVSYRISDALWRSTDVWIGGNNDLFFKLRFAVPTTVVSVARQTKNLARQFLNETMMHRRLMKMSIK